MPADKSSTRLLLSSLLPDWYPAFWEEFKPALERNQIRYSFLGGTKDVWARDYMPVQVTDDKYVQFTFKPDYTSYHNPITNQAEVIPQTGLDPVMSDIILDGGNVVKCRNKVIITSKIFLDNPEIPSNMLIKSIQTLLEVDQVIIIPAMPGVETGHSDGMVRFIDENKVFLVDYPKENNNAFVDGVRSALLTAGLEIVPLPYLAHLNSGAVDDTGDYINFLQVGHVIFVPQYGLKEDQPVLELFTRYFPGYKIEPVRCNELAKGGGVLNGISWNILDQEIVNDWEKAFEERRQAVTEKLHREIAQIKDAKDFSNPIHLMNKKFYELHRRRKSLYEQNGLPCPGNPGATYSIKNSFKEQVLKDFYYEWTADKTRQEYTSNKASQFALNNIPELRSKHRSYMRSGDSNYSYAFQPEYID